MANAPSGQRRRGRPPKGTRGDTRQELLDAALRLFARQGYAATTVRQIADEVGVRDSAIYVHFEAKKELLDSLIDESGPQLIDRIGYDFPALSEQPPARVLPGFLDRLVEEWDRPRQRELISLLIREGLADASDVLSDVIDRFRKHFLRWIEEGQLRKDVPVDLLVWELLTPLVAIRILHLNAHAKPAERRRSRELARAHVQYFLGTATG